MKMIWKVVYQLSNQYVCQWTHTLEAEKMYFVIKLFYRIYSSCQELGPKKALLYILAMLLKNMGEIEQ